MVFQSTPPVKAATLRNTVFQRFQSISIHAAREGGDFDNPQKEVDIVISIHAAREGGDVRSRCAVLSMVYFNPRRP